MPKNSTYVHICNTTRLRLAIGASVGNKVKSDAYIDTPSNESPGLSTARCMDDVRRRARW